MEKRNSVDFLLCVEFNCKGIASKLQELNHYLNETKPDIVCLNETWLTDREPKFKNYNAIWENRAGVGGGVGILVKNDLTVKSLKLNKLHNGLLELIAVSVYRTDHSILNVVSVYNPAKNICTNEIKHYLKQFGECFMILGDWNAHSPLLDGKYYTATNTTGRNLETTLTEEDIVLANPPDLITYVDYRTGRGSCIDLCITSANIAADVTVSQGTDLGSDHCPIQVVLQLSPYRNAQSYHQKWKLHDINWREFKSSIPNREIVFPSDVKTIANSIKDRLNFAATNTTRLTSGKAFSGRKTTWWNGKVDSKIKDRRRRRKKCEKHPTMENVIELKRAAAEARYALINSKKQSWRKFVSTLSVNCPVSKVWEKVRKLKGTSKPNNYPLFSNGMPIFGNFLKANTFAEHFSSACQSGTVKNPIDIEETIYNAFNDKGQYDIDSPLTNNELQCAMLTLKNNSPGSDKIPNEFLKNSSSELKSDLLVLYNLSWSTGVIPEDWKHGIVVPILKEGKDKTAVDSYRPITLLNTVGKLMEKIVSSRLQHFIEKHNLLAHHQAGFRKNHSTLDVLLQLENNLKRSIEAGNTTIVIYIDLKGAFDKVWHKGLIYKMAKLKLPPKLFTWISNFLSGRTFQVRMGAELSETIRSRAGVPQGSVLSPTLFNIMLADMPQADNIDIYSYADDITISCTKSNIKITKETLQPYLKKLAKWFEDWGFLISTDKCKMQIYSKRKINDCIIKINNNVLPVIQTKKLLGVTLDSPRLTFIPHVQILAINIRKRLDIMKSIASTYWGAAENNLKLFYISYVRAKMDYGAILYNSAPEKHLERLTILQNKALRLILGARNTSPITSMEVLSQIPPLNLHREHSKARMFIKLLERPANDKTTKTLFINSSNLMLADPPANSFMSNIINILHSFSITTWQRSPMPLYPLLTPWKSVSHLVHPYMTTDNTNWLSHKIDFIILQSEKYVNHYKIYTDGSKLSNNSCACAFYIENLRIVRTFKLSGNHSIMAAELYAILQALNYIKYSMNMFNYVIFTDSQAATFAIRSMNHSYRLLVDNIQEKLHELNINRIVEIQWVKGHADIDGNIVADRAANFGHNNTDICHLPIAKEEQLCSLKTGFVNKWNNYYKGKVENSGVGAHTLMLFNKVQNVIKIPINNRRIEVVLNRLKIGHVGVPQYLHRFNMAPSPICTTCNVPHTLEHFLLFCTKYNVERINMKFNLSLMNINVVDLKTLLGSSSFPFPIKVKINNELINYIIKTNTISKL